MQKVDIRITLDSSNGLSSLDEFGHKNDDTFDEQI